MLNYIAFILNINHPPHDNYPAITNKLGLSILVDIRQIANLNFLSLLIQGYIDSLVLLSMIKFKSLPLLPVLCIHFIISKCNVNYFGNQLIIRMAYGK